MIKYVDCNLIDFNYTSDIHLDFWILRFSLEEAFNIFMTDVKKSDVLIVAGDLTNDNDSSIYLLNFLLNKWKFVILVSGNHDYYELGTANKIFSEQRRFQKIKEHFKHNENLIILDRDIAVFNNNLKIAGCNLWYDMDNPSVYSYVLFNMNDTKMIGIKFIEEESKLDKDFYVNTEADIYVTHVPLIDQFDFTNTAYCRNLPIRENKIYIYGHMHESESDYIQSINTHFLTKPIGYTPNKNTKIGYFKL